MKQLRHFIKDAKSRNQTIEEWKEHDRREAIRIAEEAKQRRIARDIEYRKMKAPLNEKFAREPTWRESIWPDKTFHNNIEVDNYIKQKNVERLKARARIKRIPDEGPYTLMNHED